MSQNKIVKNYFVDSLFCLFYFKELKKKKFSGTTKCNNIKKIQWRYWKKSWTSPEESRVKKKKKVWEAGEKHKNSLGGPRPDREGHCREGLGKNRGKHET